MNNISVKENEGMSQEESAWSDFKSADSTTPASDPLTNSEPTSNEPASNEPTRATSGEDSKAEDR